MVYACVQKAHLPQCASKQASKQARCIATPLWHSSSQRVNLSNT